ncbi:DJ-1/PfpI family protein [Sphingosinicella sp. CPCC 101087]|uniref:DJ-1/PfpI family protein n=1 Tax=Sphingosinicella sp. CPCC 101087 TaxID=2497754 RepID=UPI00101D7559|nr:DJ-1/PfpI family protein [Sphingosinicella sp. CPCC 101087]
MNRRLAIRVLAGVAGLLAAAGAAWIVTLPPVPAASAAAAPVPAQETAATLSALRPPKRRRPLIAIIGINDATETTDYLMPYGILRRADVADVVALSTEPGPVDLYPALKVVPQATVAEFDRDHPRGADYVIVPAMSRDDDPAALQWIRSQAGKGAITIGICAGAKVVAAAGLLDGRRATTHWYYLREMLERHPTIQYVRNRRFVVDRGVATTTGITASMPMMLTLIEAVAGPERAGAVARDLGLSTWDARHDSSGFLLSRPFVTTVMANAIPFWNREQFGIRLTPGIDEVSLALVADAWSRTYRSTAVTYAASADPRRSRNGLLILPDRVESGWAKARTLPDPSRQRPAEALEQALQALSHRFGPRTAAMVAMQLEYPRSGSGPRGSQ